MVDIGNYGDIDEKLGIRITKNYVTWGALSFDQTLCMNIPEFGYVRRDLEQAVLPHAIGCQAPIGIDEYIAIFKGHYELDSFE